MDMSETTPINCMKCRHFYITWDPNFPRGCKAYGFKTKQMPSVSVRAASGSLCMLFEEKLLPGKEKKSRP